MKSKIITLVLMLSTISSFAQNDCSPVTKEESISEAERRLIVQKKIISLYKDGVFKKSDREEIVISDEGKSLIDELKLKGIFKEIDTNGDSICI